MDLGERIARRAIVGFEGEIEDTRYKVHGIRQRCGIACENQDAGGG